VIEEVQRRLASDPRRFLRLVDRALAPGDFELVDRELPRILERAVADTPVREILAALRSATSYASRRTHLEELIAALQQEGIDTRHAVIAAANARILRSGTSAATDGALHELASEWRQAEQRLGIELETRIFAYACRETTSLEAAIPEARDAGPGWRHGQILSVLWPHGWRVRASALSFYNEFAPHSPSDPQTLRSMAPPVVAHVELADGWWEALCASLVRDGLCELRCPAARRGELADALAVVGVRPIDTGLLLLHPFIERVDRQGDTVAVTLALEAPSR
jgi:hypothetical protein